MLVMMAVAEIDTTSLRSLLGMANGSECRHTDFLVVFQLPVSNSKHI